MHTDEARELRLYGEIYEAIKLGQPVWPPSPSYIRYLSEKCCLRLAYSRYQAYVAVREFLVHEEVVEFGLGAVVRLVRFAGEHFKQSAENLFLSLEEQLDLFRERRGRGPRTSELPQIVREAALCVLGEQC